MGSEAMSEVLFQGVQEQCSLGGAQTADLVSKMAKSRVIGAPAAQWIRGFRSVDERGIKVGYSDGVGGDLVAQLGKSVFEKILMDETLLLRARVSLDEFIEPGAEGLKRQMQLACPNRSFEAAGLCWMVL